MSSFYTVVHTTNGIPIRLCLVVGLIVAAQRIGAVTPQHVMELCDGARSRSVKPDPTLGGMRPLLFETTIIISNIEIAVQFYFQFNHE